MQSNGDTELRCVCAVACGFGANLLYNFARSRPGAPVFLPCVPALCFCPALLCSCPVFLHALPCALVFLPCVSALRSCAPALCSCMLLPCAPVFLHAPALRSYTYMPDDPALHICDEGKMVGYHGRCHLKDLPPNPDLNLPCHYPAKRWPPERIWTHGFLHARAGQGRVTHQALLLNIIVQPCTPVYRV